MGNQITFRNSKIAYYGPHTCENCGVLIVKMGTEWGGTAFTNPEGPIYPNTEWHPHVCDPRLAYQRKSLLATPRITTDFPLANAVKVGNCGYVILGEALRPDVQGGSYLVISASHTFATTAAGAWLSALERLQTGWPTWHIDLSEYGADSALTDDLQHLPQCV